MRILLLSILFTSFFSTATELPAPELGTEPFFSIPVNRFGVDGVMGSRPSVDTSYEHGDFHNGGVRRKGAAFGAAPFAVASVNPEYLLGALKTINLNLTRTESKFVSDYIGSNTFQSKYNLPVDRFEVTESSDDFPFITLFSVEDTVDVYGVPATYHYRFSIKSVSGCGVKAMNNPYLSDVTYSAVMVDGVPTQPKYVCHSPVAADYRDPSFQQGNPMLNQRCLYLTQPSNTCYADGTCIGDLQRAGLTCFGTDFVGSGGGSSGGDGGDGGNGGDSAAVINAINVSTDIITTKLEDLNIVTNTIATSINDNAVSVVDSVNDGADAVVKSVTTLSTDIRDIADAVADLDVDSTGIISAVNDVGSKIDSLGDLDVNVNIDSDGIISAVDNSTNVLGGKLDSLIDADFIGEPDSYLDEIGGSIDNYTDAVEDVLDNSIFDDILSLPYDSPFSVFKVLIPPSSNCTPINFGGLMDFDYCPAADYMRPFLYFLFAFMTGLKVKRIFLSTIKRD